MLVDGHIHFWEIIVLKLLYLFLECSAIWFEDAVQTVGKKTWTVMSNEVFVFKESARGQQMPGSGPVRHIFTS